MEQYTVTGMSCAACQARVEKAVSAVPGVESCAVSLLTNSMGVEGSAAPQEITLRVTNAQGVDLPCARAERDGDTVTVTSEGEAKNFTVESKQGLNVVMA